MQCHRQSTHLIVHRPEKPVQNEFQNVCSLWVLKKPYVALMSVYMLFLLLTSLAYGLNSYSDLLRAKAPAKAQIKSR